MAPWSGERSHKLIPLVIFTLTTLLLFAHCAGDVYQDVSRLYEDKFGPNSAYKATIRPKRNQSQILEVTVYFDIIAIIEVAATTQKFVINGFMALYWIDELLAWNRTEYKTNYIHPEPRQVWRPRMILVNTIERRDLFGDDHSPMTAFSSGQIMWFPGSLFPTSCKLDLYKYPFDEQECEITMLSMGLSVNELMFKSALGVVGNDFFVESGEWNIVSARLVAGGDGEDNLQLSHITIIFNLQRLPGFFVVNIVIPIVLMSFLNILVFLIPVESGEKIGYGITVLLALTVFMSIVSEQLPRSSDTLPIVTVYLLVLTIISVCTVMMSIVIVYLHHRDEREVKHQKATADFKSVFRKFSIVNRAAKSFSKIQQVAPAETNNQFLNTSTKKPENKKSPDQRKKRSGSIFNVRDDVKEKLEKNERLDDKSFETSHVVNRWRQIGRHLDFISFVVFTVIWMSVTIGFLVEMAR